MLTRMQVLEAVQLFHKETDVDIAFIAMGGQLALLGQVLAKSEEGVCFVTHLADVLNRVVEGEADGKG